MAQQPPPPNAAPYFAFTDLHKSTRVSWPDTQKSPKEYYGQSNRRLAILDLVAILHVVYFN